MSTNAAFRSGIEVLDPSLEDSADHPVVGFALDLELLQNAVNEQRNALFQRLGVDDQLAEIGLLLLKEVEDFLEDRPLFGAFVGFAAQCGGINGFVWLLGWRVGQFLVVVVGIVLGRDVGWGLGCSFRAWSSWVVDGAPLGG